MHNTRHVTEDIIWVGGNDRRLERFENLFPIPRGVSYNSYLILDKKTVLMDTVDLSVTEQFLANLEYRLGNRGLDYLVVQHMEPDHCANIGRLAEKYPDMKIAANMKTVSMLGQFFDESFEERIHLVKEGDILETGKHKLKFIMAPMVHWPEVMVTYDETEKLLFSADAFGTFGALNGNLFSDEVHFERDWLADARRYYANIVGKYGMQVQALLKKASSLDIQIICPLHGPVWRENIEYFIEKYDRWSRYEPEDKEIVIIYGSIYGYTESAVNALASLLAEKGIKNIAVYDVSKTHVSELIAEIFRASHLVLACPTYNGGLYPPVESLLSDMKALNVQKRTVAVIENGSWAATAGKQIVKKLEELKEISVLEQQLTIKSMLKQGQTQELEAFASQIADAL